jgi:translation initiation factor 2 beta subunit (eIF-2beta)/eIF-5
VVLRAILEKYSVFFSLDFAAQLSRDKTDTGFLCRKAAMLGELSEKYHVVLKTKIPFFVSDQVSAMAHHFAG